MKCEYPECENDGVVKFTTRDGKQHAYCSIDHANDHRNILLAESMKK